MIPTSTIKMPTQPPRPATLLSAVANGVNCCVDLSALLEAASLSGKINERGALGRTALHLACMMTFPADFISRLIDAGADVNAVDDKGDSVLMIAVLRCDTDAVRLLLERGADVQTVDREGRSVLVQAERYARHDVRDLIRGAAGVSGYSMPPAPAQRPLVAPGFRT